MRLFRSRKPKSIAGHTGSEVLVYDHIEHSEQQQHHPPSASAASATTATATTMSQQHAFSTTTTTTTTGTATAHGLTVDETQQLNNEVVVVAWDTSVESVAATTVVPVLILVDDIDNNNNPRVNRTTDRVDASDVNVAVAAAAATITNRTHSTSAMVTDCQDDWMKGDFAIDNHEPVTTALLVEPWPDTTKNVDARQAIEQERNLIRKGNNQGFIHASVDREGIDRARRNIYANNYWERIAVEEANRMAAYRKREEELGLCQTSRLVPIPTSTTGSAPPVAPSTMKEPALSSTFGKEYDVANYDTQEYKTSDYEVSGYKSVYER